MVGKKENTTIKVSAQKIGGSNQSGAKVRVKKKTPPPTARKSVVKDVNATLVGKTKILRVEPMSTVDKQKVKKVRDDIHEKVNSHTTGMSAKRTKKLLSDVAKLYIDFIRSQKPANSLNVQWVALDKELRKLRTARRQGQLSG